MSLLSVEQPVKRPEKTNLGAIEALAAQREALARQLRQVIVGQKEVIENVLLTIFCGGHALLVGVPGLAKTLLIRSLGRALAAGANATVVVDVLPSQRQFEDSSSQTDIRFIKMFKLGGTRKVQGIFDIYNAFNARPVLAVTTRYTGTTGGAWLRPTNTLVGRLLKFGVQFDF